jgi:indolepyruvate decarboxylase
MQDGPYNDVLPWKYERIPELLGAGRSFVIHTEKELETAMKAAQAHTESFCLLDVRLDPMDRSPALQRLAERLAKNI